METGNRVETGMSILLRRGPLSRQGDGPSLCCRYRTYVCMYAAGVCGVVLAARCATTCALGADVPIQHKRAAQHTAREASRSFSNFFFLSGARLPVIAHPPT